MTTPKFIDTHTHLNFRAFRGDFDAVIERTLTNNIWLINVGTQFETSRRAVEIADGYSDGVYAAVGLHPIHLFASRVDEEETSFLTRGEEFDPDSYKELIARSVKVAAIGEFGLDYFRLPPDEDPDHVKAVQAEVVRQHLRLAKDTGKPVMIHCRDAYDDLISILKAHYQGLGEIHSFTGTWEQARKFLDLGFYIGLNGIITFDKTGRSGELVKNLPLDRIVLETDAPYLTPVPHRGQRNQPNFVEHTAQKIAEWKNLSLTQVAEITVQNTRTLYQI